MHPDEVRKREREALPPLKNDNGTFRIKEGSLDGFPSFPDGHFDLKLNILNDY